MDGEQALQCLAQWGQQPLPISGASHDGRVLRLRLEGGEGSVAAAHDRLGGQQIDPLYWQELNEQRLAFFTSGLSLWRLSLPDNTGVLDVPGEQLIDWAGAQRWLKSDADGATIRAITRAAGGHATCYSHGMDDSPFHPLPSPLLRYHRQLKAQLDPHGIFNPGRMYAEI
jgi:glycolate oxidase FAD binding subunit